jgi:hypothetical protein
MVDINKEVPRIKTVEQLREYLNPIYQIDKYTTSPKEYESFITRIWNIVRGCIDIEECREYPVTFKFTEGGKKYKVELRLFLDNICIWYPFSLLGDLDFMDDSFIIQPEQTPKVNDFINEHILTVLRKYHVKNIDINKFCAKTTAYVAAVSTDFSIIMGLHYDESTFQQMYMDPEYREMINTKFEGTEQPAEIEDKLHQVQVRFIEKIRNDKNNPISVLIRSGTGLKEKQLVEFMIMVGMRPTLNNEIVTYPINNGLLIDGLDRPSYMYIDALGARKPVLANNKEMGPVGYFCKTLNLAVRSLEIWTKEYNCGTDFTVTYEIKSHKHLNLLRGKYMYDEDMDDFKLVDTKNSKLVGKKIKVRSAVTCCCGQNRVCPVCVGEIVNYNYDIAKGFSVFITEQWSKDVEQNVLSTKHLLITKSERIEFSDAFNKNFKLEGEEIKLLDGIKNAKELAIFIEPDEIKKVEELDPNSTYNTYIDTGRFYIVNTKTGEMTEASVLNGKKIYIRSETSTILEANNGYIPLKDIDEDQPIFEISINNNPLTKPFYDLIALLDSEKREDMDEVTIDTISQKLLDIFVEGNMNVPVAAGEIVLNRLCRKPNNVQKRPNFGRTRLPAYKFYGLTKVVENNESVTTGMTFEQLERQMTNLDISKRNGTGYFDPMFKEWIDMSPLHKYREEIEAEKAAGTYEG